MLPSLKRAALLGRAASSAIVRPAQLHGHCLQGRQLACCWHLGRGVIRATQLRPSRQRHSRQHGCLSPVCAGPEGAHPPVQVRPRTAALCHSRCQPPALDLRAAGNKAPMVPVAACCCPQAIRNSTALSLHAPARYLPLLILASIQSVALRPGTVTSTRPGSPPLSSRAPTSHPAIPCVPCRVSATRPTTGQAQCQCRTQSSIHLTPMHAWQGLLLGM